MIRVYFMPVLTTGDTQHIACEDLIHGAVILGAENPLERKLIMDTNTTEHNTFVTVASSWRDPTTEELITYNSQHDPGTPSPDFIRAEEIFTNSPPLIPMTEIQELIRIIGRHLGYPNA